MSRMIGVNAEKEVEVIDVGELMSKKHCFVSGDIVFHISVIDFFQQWDLSKKGERFIKTMLFNKDGPTLSAIEPVQYAKRFKKFCE